MTDSTRSRTTLSPDVCVRALEARDARFDGVFFVGITSTSIYCRPVCPARVSRPHHRRFFDSAACAEREGFRPCRRCRPELAPGRALVDAVSNLAGSAARRIAAGALNGRPVRDLAAELFVSERHLRRALVRELGVSPIELAQTHRLLLAKQLLTDTTLSITQVADASGFQSLRRFNSVFLERYRMNPSSLRRARRGGATWRPSEGDQVRLSLTFRRPYAWDVTLDRLAHDAIAGIEQVHDGGFRRTVKIGERRGVVEVDLEDEQDGGRPEGGCGALAVRFSHSLLPVLMPLLARMRHLLDLDAEPTVVDHCLERGGLEPLVRARPGVRIPGSFDGFEGGLRVLLLRGSPAGGAARKRVAGRVVMELGEPLATGIPGLDRLLPTASVLAEAGTSRLMALGLPPVRARSIALLSRKVASGEIRLDLGGDVASTCRALATIPGIGDALATEIATRALGWPDAFPRKDPALQRAAGAPTPRALQERAREWRPWRAYAAVHLRIQDALDRGGPVAPLEQKP